MSQAASAWQEIVERVLGRFHVVENATPDWLVDAETGRRFKVDRLYPELGVAIRFKADAPVEGEPAEEAGHDEVRARLCQEAGIALVTIDADGAAPDLSLDELRRALSAATRRLAQQPVAQDAKRTLLPRVAEAKAACQEIMAQVSGPEDLLSFAQAWEDRQFGAG
jgi:hypothetical protein